MIQFHPSDILSSVLDKKEGFEGAAGCENVCAHVTYLATSRAVVAVLASATPGLDPSAAGHVAAFPRRPGRPVDVRRAGQVFVTVPGEVMTTGVVNAALTEVRGCSLNSVGFELDSDFFFFCLDPVFFCRP